MPATRPSCGPRSQGGLPAGLAVGLGEGVQVSAGSGKRAGQGASLCHPVAALGRRWKGRGLEGAPSELEGRP